MFMKAAELHRGVKALLSFLNPYASAVAHKVLLWFTDDDLQYLGGFTFFPPAQCRLFGNAEEQQPAKHARAAPASPSLQMDLCVAPPLISTPLNKT